MISCRTWSKTNLHNSNFLEEVWISLWAIELLLASKEPENPKISWKNSCWFLGEAATWSAVILKQIVGVLAEKEQAEAAVLK